MKTDLAAWFMRALCGLRPIPSEALPPCPVVFYANHSSHLDFVSLWAALPSERRRLTRPVAGRDYWERTVARRWISERFFNALLIERRHVTVANNPMEPMCEALDRGESLIVFPEGTRSDDGQIHDFKAGLYHLVKARPGTPCVPVYLQNLSRILPKGESIPVPLIGSLHLGSPLLLEPGEDKHVFLSRARTAVESLMR